MRAVGGLAVGRAVNPICAVSVFYTGGAFFIIYSLFTKIRLTNIICNVKINIACSTVCRQGFGDL